MAAAAGGAFLRRPLRSDGELVAPSRATVSALRAQARTASDRDEEAGRPRVARLSFTS